jgi:REP element-mobilizing transposase RayT
LRAGLPNLRRDAARVAVERSFRAAGERFGLRLAQYSLQTNHIHLIAEAVDRRSLSRGMQGLLVRVARALNRLWTRRGSVFSDRFHARQLRTPREVRAALVYVLHNARHHGLRVLGIDPFSSAPWFDGWKREIAVAPRFSGSMARSWLLRVGWRLHGLIGLEEIPRADSS